MKILEPCPCCGKITGVFKFEDFDGIHVNCNSCGAHIRVDKIKKEVKE